ncbi:MAG: hypothetical protein RLZZ161_1716, partial [Bacteroidota bacterium]
MKTNRLLLVEDEADIADLVKLNLESEGYKVIAVKDGLQALQRFKEENFDLVIMDVMLPHVDGITVTENIRLTNTEIPILFLSARNNTQDRILGLKKGGDDYLTKPFNLEELLLRVQKLLSRSKVSSENDIALHEYSFGDNYVNFDSFEASGNEGTFILTKKESLLLKLLI